MQRPVARFALVLGIGIVIGVIGVGADPALTTFEPGTPIVAADVNANFSALADAVAERQVRVDGECPPDSAIRVVGADGDVVCQAVTGEGEAVGRIDAASRERVTVRNTVDAGAIGSSALLASCPDGYVATGGGAFVDGRIDRAEVAWLSTRPHSDPRSWDGEVIWTAPRGEDDLRDVFMYVVCVATL